LPPTRRPVVLCILDGVGLGSGEEDDAVATAATPTLDALNRRYAVVPLKAHGTAVGLPSDDDMGNSEVGHNAIGAGRVFDQGAKLVQNALDSGAAFETEVWRSLLAGTTLHLLGLVSDGNVHSHVQHLHALIDRAVHDGHRRLRVHALTDGRDVSGRSALRWIAPLEQKLEALRAKGVDARVASGGGRMHLTMDRYDADWEMVARGWRCHVHGVGRSFPSATVAIETLYRELPEVDDQYLPAFVVTEDGEPVGRVHSGDSVLCFNFRGDRAIEIGRAFDDPTLDRFDRGERPAVTYAGIMQYDGDSHTPRHFLVQPPEISGTVGQHLAAAGLRTFATAETQKFGHVTYFFNGNRSGLIDPTLERYVEIPSDLRPFDEAPWMKAAEVTDACINALASGGFEHVRLNYANGDMVGHTGKLDATRLAVSCVDHQLGRLLHAAAAHDAIVIVTADHGNADEMYQHKGGKVVRDAEGRPVPLTSHSLARVPFFLVDPRGTWTAVPVPEAGIASVGSTLLTLLGLPVPPDWAPTLARRTAPPG
jgi:2,3-bisphosphoglycerate-independent phosphoglycerate mutase